MKDKKNKNINSKFEIPKESQVLNIINEYESIRSRLMDFAENPNTSEGILIRLAKLTDILVLDSLACNPSISEQQLLNLLKEYSGTGWREIELRIHVAYNPQLSLNNLREIQENDISEEVRRAALIAIARKMVSNPKTKIEELHDILKQLEADQIITQSKSYSEVISEIKKRL